MTAESADAVKAARGRASLKTDAVWTAIDTLVSAGLAFVFRLVMARFLAPSEFGIFAMALTTYSIVQIINEFGMSATIIQRPAARFTDEVVETAFAASMAVSLALFVLNLVVIAPLLGWIYGSERVAVVTAVIGVSFLFTPTVSISRALLFRARNYRAVTIARIVSTIASIVLAGAALAISQSVWALVVQIVSGQVVLAASMFVISPVRLKPRFSRAAFGEMFGYSGLVFANDAFTALSKNFDVLILGQMLSTSQVGLYSLAFYITDVVRANLTSILNRVMFTQYAAVQGDLAAVRTYVLRTLSANALILLPIMVATILAGPIVLPVVLGPQWQGMGPTLQWLAVSVIIGALGGTTSTVFKALGRPGLEFMISFGTATLLLVPMLLIGVHYGGTAGAAAAVAGKVFVSVIIRQSALDRLIGSTFTGFVRASAGSLLVQLPIVLIWWIGMAILPYGPLASALMSLTAGIGAYVLSLFAMRHTQDPAWPAFRSAASVAGTLSRGN